MTTRTRTISPDTKSRFPELAAYVRERAVRHGEFRLTSGEMSTFYCDSKMASLPGRGASLISKAVAEVLRVVDFEALGGMAMGAVPIVSAVAKEFYESTGRDLPAFYVRKDAKSHGTKKRIEGPLPQQPSRVVILDDVVTTAGSILEAIDAVQELGHEVVLAISVIDRGEGGRAALEERGIKFTALVTRAELGVDEG